MARTPLRAERPTYLLARQCVLCEAPIADTDRADACRSHRVPTTVVQVPTKAINGGLLEILELTHSRVMPGGYRRWAGTGEDGRTVVWEEVAPAGGKG